MKITKTFGTGLEHMETTARMTINQVRQELLDAYRDYLMNKGYDLGGPGIFKFNNLFKENYTIEVTVKINLKFSEIDKVVK